jgi:hypothetical protein
LAVYFNFGILWNTLAALFGGDTPQVVKSFRTTIKSNRIASINDLVDYLERLDKVYLTMQFVVIFRGLVEKAEGLNKRIEPSLLVH